MQLCFFFKSMIDLLPILHVHTHAEIYLGCTHLYAKSQLYWYTHTTRRPHLSHTWGVAGNTFLHVSLLFCPMTFTASIRRWGRCAPFAAAHRSGKLSCMNVARISVLTPPPKQRVTCLASCVILVAKPRGARARVRMGSQRSADWWLCTVQVTVRAADSSPSLAMPSRDRARLGEC